MKRGDGVLCASFTKESFLFSRYTDDAEYVIGKLEDEITPEHAINDKQAKTRKYFEMKKTFFHPGFGPKIETEIQDICLWLLHSG